MDQPRRILRMMKIRIRKWAASRKPINGSEQQLTPKRNRFRMIRRVNGPTAADCKKVPEEYPVLFCGRQTMNEYWEGGVGCEKVGDSRQGYCYCLLPVHHNRDRSRIRNLPRPKPYTTTIAPAVTGVIWKGGP